MRLEFGVCPQCKNEISEERLSESVVVCNACGYTENKGDKKVERAIFKTFLKQGLVFSVLSVGLFIQSVKYDKYAFEVIPLQVAQMTGMASSEDYARLAQIFKDRKDWEGQAEALIQQYKKNPQSVQALFELGELQFKRKQYGPAIQTLDAYLTKGGLELKALYYKAQAHGELGQIDQASQSFEQILEAKPETLQITVATKYVALLMKHQRTDQARIVIEKIRSLGVNANLFMDREFQALAKK